jgi:hypothetical protein
VSFKNVDGLATDPNEVYLRVMDPSGGVTEYAYTVGQISRDSTGEYWKSVILSSEGTWNYQWRGTGSITAATEGRLEVARSVFD